MPSKISAFASLKEFKLTSFESLLRKKEISSKPRVASQGMLQDTGMAPGCVLQEPCSEKISGNCLVCTFCALLNFELRFFFFRQTKALYASDSLFLAPFEELSIQKKIVRALDLWCRVFQGPHTEKGHPPQPEQNEQGFSILKTTVSIFSP